MGLSSVAMAHNFGNINPANTSNGSLWLIWLVIKSKKLLGLVPAKTGN
jgi:hypothetical protein